MSRPGSFKELLIRTCLEELTKRGDSLNKQLGDLLESQQSDSKSSAGDKHETAREMAAQEIGKLNRSVELNRSMQEELSLVQPDLTSPSIRHGSLVQTQHGLYFLATSLGRINVSEKEVMVISTKAPLAVKMLSKQRNDTVSYNGMSHTIERVE